jgi:NADH-quinone oxidoreductase subunit K
MCSRFEATSILILVAMVGAVVLARAKSRARNDPSQLLPDRLGRSCLRSARAGVFLRRNVITILLSIEIMLNAVNLTFVAFGRLRGRRERSDHHLLRDDGCGGRGRGRPRAGIALFRHRESLNPDAFTSLKW